MKKYLTELIGTFFLVLLIGCTVVGGAPGVIPPLAIGAGLMAIIYAGGHVSGAHYNPAITVAFYLRGRLEAKEVPGYIGAQLVGAVLAALAVGFLKPGAEVSAMELAVAPAFVAELLCTFLLAYVILNVATAKATAGNAYFGLAIGMTVMSCAFAVGSISGCALNPAVAISLAMMGLARWSNLWVYLAADFVGAAVAALAFRAMHPDDR